MTTKREILDELKRKDRERAIAAATYYRLKAKGKTAQAEPYRELAMSLAKECDRLLKLAVRTRS